MDRADGRVHALGAHHRDDLRDLRRLEVRELAVVDRDVGDAAGAVARQPTAGNLAQHAPGGGTQPHGVAARVDSSCAYSMASRPPR
jgi:hypothetical protein